MSGSDQKPDGRLPMPRVEYEQIRERFFLARKYAASPMPGQDVKQLIARIDPERLNRLIETRLAALAGDKPAEADQIRDELAEQGIHLQDELDPATSQPTTTWILKR